MGRNSGGGSRRPSGSSGGSSSSGGGSSSGTSSSSSSGGRVSGGRRSQPSSRGSGGHSSKSDSFFSSSPSSDHEDTHHHESTSYHTYNNNYSPRYNIWNNGGYHSGGYNNNRLQQTCLKGCLTGCLTTVLVVVIFFVAASIYVEKHPDDVSQSEPQTMQSVPAQASVSSVQAHTDTHAGKLIPAVIPSTGEYYTDNLEWINNPYRLNIGMKSFYKETGVKPYLYLTDHVNGNSEPSDEEMGTFANDLYDQLFTDENHFLLVFQEAGGYYMTWYISGLDAAATIDETAAETILDYVDKYYSSDMEDEEYFSTVFTEAGRAVMQSKTPVPES